MKPPRNGAARSVTCPTCEAAPGAACRYIGKWSGEPGGIMKTVHAARVRHVRDLKFLGEVSAAYLNGKREGFKEASTHIIALLDVIDTATKDAVAGRPISIPDKAVREARNTVTESSQLSKDRT